MLDYITRPSMRFHWDCSAFSDALWFTAEDRPLTDKQIWDRERGGDGKLDALIFYHVNKWLVRPIVSREEEKPSSYAFICWTPLIRIDSEVLTHLLRLIILLQRFISVSVRSTTSANAFHLQCWSKYERNISKSLMLGPFSVLWKPSHMDFLNFTKECLFDRFELKG